METRDKNLPEAARRREERGVTVLHDLHHLQHLLHVLPGCDQTLQHQHLVVDEHVAVGTAHHLHTQPPQSGSVAVSNSNNSDDDDDDDGAIHPRPQTPRSA